MKGNKKKNEEQYVNYNEVTTRLFWACLTIVVDIVIAEVVLEFWQNEYESESNPKPGRSGPAYKMLMGSLLIE